MTETKYGKLFMTDLSKRPHHAEGMIDPLRRFCRQSRLGRDPIWNQLGMYTGSLQHVSAVSCT